MTVSEVCKILKEHNNFEILTHASPDGDTLGCGFALCLALQQIGKNARVITEKALPPKFKYLAKGVKEQEFQREFVVSTDVADPSLLGDNAEKYKDIIDLCIDHHDANLISAEYKLINARAAAACEIIYEVVGGLGAEITPQIADCLYTGISTDTGCFCYANTTSATHRIASALMDAGCDFARINKEMFETKTKSRMALEHGLYDSMEFFARGRGAITCVSLDMLKRLNLTADDTEGIESIPRQIEGVLMGITMKEKEPGVFKVSVRTNEGINASDFCGKFGGGGHIGAAGCKLKGTCEEVRQRLINAAEEIL